MCRPEARFDRVEQLTPGVLEGLGVRALLLDLDETLLPGHAEAPEAAVLAWAATLQAGGVPLAIVSNGRRERVRRVAAALGVPGHALCGKPWPRAYRGTARRLGVAPERCAMVGDQLFTDVLGARLAGLRALLVTPRSTGGLPHTRALRRLETLVLRGGMRGRTHDR